MASMAMFTPALIEGFLYGEISLFNLPSTIYNNLFKYFYAVPFIYLSQVYLLGAKLELHLPSSLSGLFLEKRHMSGWIEVDLTSTD